MPATESDGPNWDRLFETASGQSGYVTTSQAAEAGYSTHLLRKHIHAGRVTRAQRGIYRLVHFPATEHEELVAAWLWSQRSGVISHQTALSLHGLSDVLPAQIHVTLPAAWRKRRFRVPPDVVLHHSDVAPEDRAWFSAVPVTSPRRTLNDCAREGLSPELLRQAAQQALRRGLVTKAELGDVDVALEPFGGLAHDDPYVLISRGLQAGPRTAPAHLREFRRRVRAQAAAPRVRSFPRARRRRARR